MTGKVKAVIIVIAVMVISGVVSFFSVVAATGKTDRIFPGVALKGTPLGNKSRNEVLKTLDEYVNSLKNESITVKFGNRSAKFKLADINLQVNAASIMNMAWAVGRQGNFLNQWQDRKNVARNGREVPVEFSFDQNKLNSILQNLTKEFNVPPRDAELVVTPSDAVQILESSEGRGVDLRNASEQVMSIINGESAPEIVLKIVNLKPVLTTQDLENMRVNGELARFTTYFDAKKTNRVFNIRVAAQALDGRMIKPGEVFSFNEVVGPRSQEAGYKLAPSILNNEFIDSLGGGVCQVSTTLYNTLLQADMEIVERSNHSLTISYVPIGQDAAVAYGYKDLKFKNNLPGAVIIKSTVSGNTVTLKLFGDVAEKKSVHIVNNIVKEYPFQIVYKNDATLAQGSQRVDQKGTKGYRVMSRKSVYQNGQMLGEKPLSESYYKPLNEIILVGSKPVYGKPNSGPGNNGENNPEPVPTTVPEEPASEPVPPIAPPAELPSGLPSETPTPAPSPEEPAAPPEVPPTEPPSDT